MQIKDYIDEHNELKLRTTRLENNLRNAEDETKRNQDAVQRLLEDLERTRRVMDNADVLKDVSFELQISQ